MLGKQPDEPLWVLFTILAVWRLTCLIAYEEGPFGLFVIVRRTLVKFGSGRLAGCFYCLSVWVSLLVLAVFPLDRSTPLVWLGVAGAVAAIERLIGGGGSMGGED